MMPGTGAPPPSWESRKIQKLRKINADLLAALEELLDTMPAPRSRKVTHKWDAARAAISKAKETNG
jgi:hypothetical protein